MNDDLWGLIASIYVVSLAAGVLIMVIYGVIWFCQWVFGW